MSTDEIGIVFPAANLRGGVERVIHDALHTFAATHRTAFIGEELDHSLISKVRFSRVEVPEGSRLTRPLRFRAAAAEVLAQQRPEILISFGVTCPPGDIRWVQSVHRAWVDRGSPVNLRGIRVPSQLRKLLPRHRLLLSMERRYFTETRPRAVLCTSQHEVDDLRHYYGVDPAVLHVVPNGFDGKRFNAATRDRWRGTTRAELGIQDGDISLLFPVNELHRKGFAVLLEAVAALRDPRLRIDVVGRAPLDAYAGQISRLGLGDRVKWHGPTSTVERFMAAGDVMVLPTQYEPFGLVVVEALATGLPVVTTKLAGAAPAVREGQNGLLQENPLDAEELTHLLRRAADDGERTSWADTAAGSVDAYEWGSIMTRVRELIAT